MTERHVAAQDIGGDHPGEVDRILGAAELGRVAQLGFFEVVDRRAHLDGHGQGADPLVHRRTVLAERLRAEDFAVGFAEDDLHPDHLGARVVPGVRIREEIDLLVVRVAEPLERFLADAGPGGRAAEQSDDRGALGAAVAGIAPGDHIGRDAALAVRRSGQRDQAPLAGHEILDLDGIADGEDVRVARAHVLVDADAAAFADLEAGRLGQRRVRPHADGEDHDVRRIRLAGPRLDLDRAAVQLLESDHAVIGDNLHAMPSSYGPGRGTRSPGPAGPGPDRASGRGSRRTRMDQVLRRLETDESAADHHRAASPASPSGSRSS